MFEVLLTILVLFFIFRQVSGWIVRYIIRRHAKRAGHSTFEETSKKGPDRKKIFKKEDGEYIDFEEIKPNNPPN